MSKKVNKRVSTRVVTNKEIRQYEPMVEKYIREKVSKNWTEAKLGKKDDQISLGNTGMTMADFRQYLRTEVFIALRNYDPNYRTPEGRSVKESTFVFGHLFKRVGSLCKRLTNRRYGYGVWSSNLEEMLGETDKDE